MGKENEINRTALVIVLAVVVAAILLLVAIPRANGPVARCEDVGGHYLVGPGGETACVDRRTFLPIIEYERQ